MTDALPVRVTKLVRLMAEVQLNESFAVDPFQHRLPIR